MLAAAHSDQVLAGMGITMKVERIPTAINLGICQGSMPIISYNFASGNRERMDKTINTARLWGLCVSACGILFFQLFAPQVCGLFMDTSSGEAALATVGFATLFMKIRSLASPVQFINYHSSYCMQAMGNGKGTIIHAVVREIGLYIPFMIILDKLFGETSKKFFNQDELRDWWTRYLDGEEFFWSRIYAVYAFLIWYDLKF
jgi:Na+-driven multidrug efflux pump